MRRCAACSLRRQGQGRDDPSNDVEQRSMPDKPVVSHSNAPPLTLASVRGTYAVQLHMGACREVTEFKAQDVQHISFLHDFAGPKLYHKLPMILPSFLVPLSSRNPASHVRSTRSGCYWRHNATGPSTPATALDPRCEGATSRTHTNSFLGTCLRSDDEEDQILR